MTEDQLKAIFHAKSTKPVDPRRFWRRLLASLRIDIKLGKNTDKPLSYVGIKGKADF